MFTINIKIKLKTKFVFEMYSLLERLPRNPSHSRHQQKKSRSYPQLNISCLGLIWRF